MLFLTEDAQLICKHVNGKVEHEVTQDWVTIADRRVLVDDNPEKRPIKGCPIQLPLKPCLTTLAVQEGYSEWIRIDKQRVCLDTVTGLTDGTPPGTVHYIVQEPGQDFITEQPA